MRGTGAIVIRGVATGVSDQLIVLSPTMKMEAGRSTATSAPNVRTRVNVRPLPNICDPRYIVTVATFAAVRSGTEPPVEWVGPSSSLDVSVSAGTRSPDAVHRC